MTDACTVTVSASGVEAFRVDVGQTFRITDPEGGQVGDLFAFAAEDPEEWLSASHTRAAVSRLFPKPGEQFFTTRRRPILTFRQDHSPGRHDMLIAACDSARYVTLGQPGHASCARNLFTGLARCGIYPRAVPQPVNVFMDVLPGTTGDLTWTPASTSPGDFVAFEAAIDCVVVLSACPQDLAPVNHGGPTPLVVTLGNGASPQQPPAFDRVC
ncbi:urea carboxylase-associated family protein [Streptomyces sp. ME01-18a]|uniref:urea carboxylase-associated family protein n=1 Tax=Streptomyces sp. ME01-18a TaxID=3028669 RepID=UPI0029B3451F|nr:urea carboxylase-associated family protein [Streptomyces sp. ME01-18a]MDX3434325.1 urea carboxylase-associated family protein [Streptomyces sp. ME01-18a]